MPRRLKLSEDQVAFARKLFELYPTFLPTRALYVDLEGGGSGNESIVSLFWPQNSRDERFAWIARTVDSPIDHSDIEAACDQLGLHQSQPRWVVTYAQGRYESEERERVIELLGQDPWPNAVWVNLLHVFQESREMTSAIRRHRHVRYRRDRTRIRRSLESLEWEFGIRRPASIRSRSNEYSDGVPGEMGVLSLANQLIRGTISPTDERTLYRYCKQDVWSMFRIRRDCERGVFGPSARGRRYAENDTLMDRSSARSTLDGPAVVLQVEDSDPEITVFDYCPKCGEEFLKTNRHGVPFSPRQRNAQFNAHNRRFHQPVE